MKALELWWEHVGLHSICDGMGSARDLIPTAVIYAGADAECRRVSLHGQDCDQADHMRAVFSLVQLATKILAGLELLLYDF